MTFDCTFCDNKFISKSSLNNHIKTAKYCLKIQGKYNTVEYICDCCGKSFNGKYQLNRHLKICKIYISENNYKEKYIESENKNQILLTEIKMVREMLKKSEQKSNEKDEMIKHLQDKLGGIAEKAASRPTTQNNRNIQINNIIQKMEPMNFDEIKSSADQLTLAHHKLGAEGYAKFALEGPFKNKLMCADRVRQIFKYKNDDGDMVVDEGLERCFGALCDAIKMKSYLLAQEHYQELAQKFTEREMDLNCNTMDWAIGLARFKLNKNNKFCKEVIDYLKKMCNSSIET